MLTQRDAAEFVTKAEHDAPEWQAAMEALLLVAAERDGPTMFAWIAMMRALHRQRQKAAPAPSPIPRRPL